MAWQLQLPDYFAFHTNWLLQEEDTCLVHAELRESGSKPFLHEGLVLIEGIIAAHTVLPQHKAFTHGVEDEECCWKSGHFHVREEEVPALQACLHHPVLG